jgi:hypothetical protein
MAGKSTPGIISALPSSTKDTPANLEDAGGTGEYKSFITDSLSSLSPVSPTLGGCVIANSSAKAISEHKKRLFGMTKHVDPFNYSQRHG